MANRKWNRTNSHQLAGTAPSNPKWAVLEGSGGKVLVSIGRGQKHYIRRGKDNKWEGVPARDMYLYTRTPEPMPLTPAEIAADVGAMELMTGT